MGMGCLQGPGRRREAVLLWWEWRAGTGADLGTGEQGNPTPEPTAALESSRTCVTCKESSLRSPACKLQLCLTGLGTGMCKLYQQALYPPSSSQGCCLRSALALGSDVILSMTAVRTAQLWEKDVWGRLAPGIRSLLPAFTGRYSRDGSTWPCAMLSLVDGIPCPTMELPLDHGCVWWISEPGYPHFPHCVWIPLLQVSDLLYQQKNIQFPR